jgi:hypothetical protein
LLQGQADNEKLQLEFHQLQALDLKQKHGDQIKSRFGVAIVGGGSSWKCSPPSRRISCPNGPIGAHRAARNAGPRPIHL